MYNFDGGGGDDVDDDGTQSVETMKLTASKSKQEQNWTRRLIFFWENPNCICCPVQLLTAGTATWAADRGKENRIQSVGRTKESGTDVSLREYRVERRIVLLIGRHLLPPLVSFSPLAIASDPLCNLQTELLLKQSRQFSGNCCRLLSLLNHGKSHHPRPNVKHTRQQDASVCRGWLFFFFWRGGEWVWVVVFFLLLFDYLSVNALCHFWSDEWWRLGLGLGRCV